MQVEYLFFIFSVLITIFVIIIQILNYKNCVKTITSLALFFPKDKSIFIKEVSIPRRIILSSYELEEYIYNGKIDVSDNDLDKIEVNLIEVGGEYNNYPLFRESVCETNLYLCKNIGTSADFPLIQDIYERKLDSIEARIAQSINTPLYLGLIGTFLGIIVGLLGIICGGNIISNESLTTLTSLFVGIISAMIASTLGVLLMIRSTRKYKQAINDCENNKASFYDLLRRELMPILSSSMASSLNSLKSVLGEFVGKFGHNLDAYVNSAELLNDNIEKQHLLLIEVNKMNQKKIALQLADTFNTIKSASESLDIFKAYQDNLNNTIQNIGTIISKIDMVFGKFDDFGHALNVVINNQNAAAELQQQFRVAIETNFPTGNDARAIWRKQYDELSQDALSVTNELMKMLELSTKHIDDFVRNNNFINLNEILQTMTSYVELQANCYKDLKQEIYNLKNEQITSRADYAKLNGDLLIAVKEMIIAVKSYNR